MSKRRSGLRTEAAQRRRARQEKQAAKAAERAERRQGRPALPASDAAARSPLLLARPEAIEVQ
jgi:hypothetical protein